MSQWDASAMSIRIGQSSEIASLIIGVGSVGADCIACLHPAVQKCGITQAHCWFMPSRTSVDFSRAVELLLSEATKGMRISHVQVHLVVEMQDDVEASVVSELHHFVRGALARLELLHLARLYGYIVDMVGHVGVAKSELDLSPYDSCDMIGTDCTQDEAICEVVERILGVLFATGEGHSPLELPFLELSNEAGNTLLWLLLQFDKHIDEVTMFTSDVSEFITSVLPSLSGPADKTSLAKRLRFQVNQALCDYNCGPNWVNNVLAARDVLSLRGVVDDALRQNELRRQNALRQLVHLRAEPCEGTLALEQFERDLRYCSSTDEGLRALQLQIDVELSRCGALMRWMARIQDVLRETQQRVPLHDQIADDELSLQARYPSMAEVYKTYMHMLLLYEYAWSKGGYAEATMFLRDYIDVLALRNINQMIDSSTYDVRLGTEGELGFDALGTARTEPVDEEWKKAIDYCAEGVSGGMN